MPTLVLDDEQKMRLDRDYYKERTEFLLRERTALLRRLECAENRSSYVRLRHLNAVAHAADEFLRSGKIGQLEYVMGIYKAYMNNSGDV